MHGGLDMPLVVLPNGRIARMKAVPDRALVIKEPVRTPVVAVKNNTVAMLRAKARGRNGK